MAINDYDFEPHLSICIEKSCLMELSLRKLEGKNFVLDWKYEGPKEMMKDLYIDSVTVVDGESRWFSETPLHIDTQEGSNSFLMNLI